MKKILQYIGIALFAIFVFALGIFAFRFSSNTLVFAFAWEQNQQGNRLLLAIDRPGTISRIIPAGTLLDEAAIRQSLLLNGENISAEQLQNYDIISMESFVSIEPKNPNEWDVLTISSALYNSQKKTSYLLPADIVLTISHTDRSVEITENPLSIKDGMFHISLKGYDNASAKNILWYVYYPVQNESCDTNGILWNARKYRKVDSEIISENTDNTEKYADVRVDYNPTADRQCLIAGIDGHIELVVERNLSEFSLSGALTRALSPEKNLKSQVTFSSTSPLLPDIGADSEAYDKVVSALKSNIVKKLATTPTVDITEENIMITPDAIKITGEFQEWQKYTVHLPDIEDIYGRTTSNAYTFSVTNDPFLSFDSSLETSRFASGTSVKTRVFALATPKHVYDLKICRLDSEAFSQFSDIIQSENPDQIREMYSMMNSPRASECEKKKLDISGNMIHEIEVEKFFEKSLRPGFYVLAFRDYDDISGLSAPVFPWVFSVNNSDIITHVSSTHASFLVTDIVMLQPKANQEIEIFPKISDEISSSSLNIAQYATGIVLGRTNASGILEANFANILEQNDTKKFLAITRGEGSFGFLSLDASAYDFSANFRYNITTNIDNRAFTPGEKIDFFAYISKNTGNISDDTFVLRLKNQSGNSLAEKRIKANNTSVITTDFDIPKNRENGVYSIEISTENPGEKTRKISDHYFQISDSVQPESQFHITFRGINFDGNSPQNLREKPNTDESKPYYTNLYTAPIQLEAMISKTENAHIFSGTPFRYKLFQKAHSSDLARGNLITEGNGTFDKDGFAYLSISTEFQSLFDDVVYTLEIESVDVLTGKPIIDSVEYIVSLPIEYKTFDDTKKPEIVLERSLFAPGYSLPVKFFIDGKWDDIYSHKYNYEMLQKVGSTDVIVNSGAISASGMTLPTRAFTPGSYVLSVFPAGVSEEHKNTFGVMKNFYVKSDADIAVEKAEIFADKNAYNPGETAKLTLLSPFPRGHILLLRSDGANTQSEYMSFSGFTIHKDVGVFSSSHPTVISAEIFADDGKTSSASLLLSHTIAAENINMSSSLAPAYKKWENNVFGISIRDSSGNPITANILMEVYKKLPNNSIYSVENAKNSIPRIALFSFGVTKNTWSQSWSVSGNPASMFQKKEMMFSKYLVANPSGATRIELPAFNDTGDYTVRIVGYYDGKVCEIQKDIVIKEDFPLSLQMPQTVYPGDKISASISVQNNTNAISLADVRLNFSGITTPLSLTGSAILNISTAENSELSFRIPETWRGDIPYVLTIEKGNEILSSLTGSIFVDEIPTIGLWRKTLGVTTDNAEIALSAPTFLDTNSSRVELALARNWWVVIPWTLEEIKNATKNAPLEQLSVFATLASLHGSSYFSTADFGVLQDEVNAFFRDDSLENIEKNMNTIDFLDILCYVFYLQKSGIVIDRNIMQNALEKYENIEKDIDNLSVDERVKVYRIVSLLSRDIASIEPRLAFDTFSADAWLDYMDGLILQQKPVSDEIIAHAEAKIYENSTEKIFDLSVPRKIRFAGLLISAHRMEKAEKILQDIFTQKSSDISSLREKTETIRTAYIHATNSPNTTVNAKFSSLSITGNAPLSRETPRYFWSAERSKIAGNLKIESEKKIPIYYEIREKNTLQAPSIFPEKVSNFLSTNTIIEKVYTDGSIWNNGQFQVTEKVDWSVPLEKNTLYKATVEINIHNTNGKNWTGLRAKIALPSGVDVIAPTHRMHSLSNTILPWTWDSVEKTQNAIFLLKNAGTGDEKLTYTYYFTLKNSWSYLLPGNFVYFLEAREFFANNSHRYIHIQ